MSKTQENLMTAFAGESQANRKYLAFAQAADKEGMPQVAKLFRAAAAAETIHAHAHLRNAGKIGNTMANLKSAIEGETYEFTKMYPEMIKDAQEEGKTAIAKYFDFVNTVEEVHATLYKKALENPAGLPATDYYICKVCGYTHEGPCDACPVCGAATRQRTGKTGVFWSCSRYPDCKGTVAIESSGGKRPPARKRRAPRKTS